MNDTFSFSRFGLLFRKFTKEHYVTYILYAAAAFGIIVLIYGLTVLSFLRGRFPPYVSIVYFMISLIFGSALFSASFYGFFHNKAKAIQYLNLPASNTEKLTLGFIFTQFAFFAIFIAGFYLVDQLMCAFYNDFHTPPPHVPPEFASDYIAEPMDFNNPIIKGTIIVALVISSVCHFGSLLFEKNAFVKIALLILIIGAGIFLGNFYSMKALIPEEVMPGGMLYSTSLRVGPAEAIKGIVFLPDTWSNFVYWFLPGMLYLLFWISCYCKLKEKQI